MTVPASYTGPIFVSGVSYKAMQDVTISGGTWSGTVTPSVGCVAWKWGAAGYSNFTSGGSALKVKPIDGAAFWDATGDPDSANDFAGTPDGPTNSSGSTHYRYSVLPWYTLDTGNGGASAQYLKTFYGDARTPTGYYGGAQVSGSCP